MSGAAVCTAIGDYLRAGASAPVGDGSIVNLTNVFDYPEKYTPDMDFYDQETPGEFSGALIYQYWPGEEERRTALGGLHSGEKLVVYTVNLDCFFRSNEAEAQTAGLLNRQFIDSLKAYIRADRLAGAPGLIFQWGEGNQMGGADLKVRRFYPRVIKGAGSLTQTYTSVTVSVCEFLLND